MPSLMLSVKHPKEGLAAKYMAEELGHDHKLVIKTDASAAVGVVLRHGTGKVKHSHIKQMWIQEKAKDGILKVEKNPRRINAADLMTHHFTDHEADVHLKSMNVARSSSSNNPVRALPCGISA